MPRKNTIKSFFNDSHYHVYNRTTSGIILFRQDKDYWTYRRFLKRAIAEFEGEVRIHSFCLMPNHYHFHVWQKEHDSLTHFMRSVSGMYASHYMHKYDFHGGLYESRYKAVYLPTSEDILRTDKYIRNNPRESGLWEWKHVGGEILPDSKILYEKGLQTEQLL